MYKMMIVDDEEWVRQRLRHTLDWESKGVEVVDEAGNGMEALDKAKRNHPDIILTDIRMPKMDGLELIRRLKENGEQAKTIIISGYSDFEYAKTALTLGAHDYILKPVEDEDLFATVERCVTQIRTERAQLALLDKAELQVGKRLPLLKQMFFSNLVHDHISSNEDIADALVDFEVANINLQHVCLLIQVYDEKLGTDRDAGGDFVQFVIRNVAQDVAGPISANEILFTHSGEVVVIVSSDLPPVALQESLEKVAEKIQQVVGRILHRSVTIGIGCVCGDMTHISRSYRQAKQSALANGYLSKANVHEAGMKADTYRRYDAQPLINAIIAGDKEPALAELAALIGRHPQMQPAELKFVYIHAVNAIVKTAFTGNRAAEAFFNYGLQLLELLNRSRTVAEIHGLLADAIAKMIDFAAKTQSKRKRKAIEKAVSYITEHYRQPISLHTVADKLMLNASYFSKIFKEEMGIPFSKYLMELKVSKAIELMNDETLKIYEIAGQVGYEDVQYFTKMFKSIKGLSPMQYRDKIMR